MSHEFGADCGGVRSLDRLMERCYVCPITGCWHCRLSFDQGSPRVSMTHPVTLKTVKMRGRRAALLLRDGKDLPAGHSAYAAPGCKSLDCVNPDHSRSGNRSKVGKALAASGRVKGIEAKKRASRESGKARRRLSVEQVRGIRTDGRSAQEWAVETGLSRFAIWSVRRGRSYRDIPFAANSIFELARTL